MFRKAYTMYMNEGKGAEEVPTGDKRLAFLCKYQAWDMYEMRKCITQHGSLVEYFTMFAVNDFVVSNWTRTADDN